MTDVVVSGLMKRRAMFTHEIEETHDRLRKWSLIEAIVPVAE